MLITPSVKALPSFARQTGQRCGACHVNGAWPQLTPWGRFFKLSGYTAGTPLFSKERALHNPAGVYGEAGITWAKQSKDNSGNTVVPDNGRVLPQTFAGEIATGITNWAGIFYEYEVANQNPGWKGASGPVDARAVHFFQPGKHELLVAFNTNNGPTVQDVWNSTPAWGYPSYGSPVSPLGAASPMITSLGQQSASLGAYALWDRQIYVEFSEYHVATKFFRWMSAGTAFQAGGANHLQSFNPYWRAYWTKEHGSQSFMIGTFGLNAHIYPDSSQPSGPTNRFTDYGFDSQYQILRERTKLTLRASYIYEHEQWNAGFPLGLSSTPSGNLKSLNVNGSVGWHKDWVFTTGYFLTNGSQNSALFGVTDPMGNQVSSSPKNSGYFVEVDRLLTQNIQLMAQYRGYTSFNGQNHNIDGLGRSPSDNNTLWLNLFFAF